MLCADNCSQNEWAVFKGGTAFNSILTEFQKQYPHAAYIIPITDDGGSSREIGRVFGGPSIGDLRSTLTRLSDESTMEASAVKKLLEHRLPKEDHEQASFEWQTLLEDRHPLYDHISSKYKGLIRYFLCQFEAERLLRIGCRFDMRNGSIGNFFFSGARMALGSLETAIFMYSSVAQIALGTHVIPIIDSNDRLGIGVRLMNREMIIGQNMISHPSVRDNEHTHSQSLPSSIARLFYIDKFNNEIEPEPNPEVIRQLLSSRGIIYGTGSFWTSIVPSLVLKGVGEAIASLKGPKIALLNCCQDRETMGMSATDYIEYLAKSLNRYGQLRHPLNAYVTDLFIVEGSEIFIDRQAINSLGIQLHHIPADPLKEYCARGKKYPVYASDALIHSLNQVAERYYQWTNMK